MRTAISIFPVLMRRFVELALATRAQALVSIFTTVAAAGTGLATFYFFYERVGTLGGLDARQGYLLYGTYLLIDGITAAILTPVLAKLPSYVKSGHLDSFLLNPVGLRGALILASPNPWRLTDVAAGVSIIGLALPADVTTHGVVLASIALLCGFALIFSIWTLVVALIMSYLRVDNVGQLFTFGISLVKFPIGSYPAWLKVFLSFVVPLGLAAGVPVSALNESGTLNGIAYLACYSLCSFFVSTIVLRMVANFYQET